jgi:cytochrome c oxidase cbb3-type subunit 1
VTVHSLSWLVAANLVGLWLATLLLVPELGVLTPGLGYGRWATLHLDLQLYGWCGLPLVGVLLWCYFGTADDRGMNDRGARAAVAVWSAALAWGAVSWLAGRSTGKIFLEWQGVARWIWLLALAFLAAVLVRGWWQGGRRTSAPARRWAGVALVPLAAVPVLFFVATDPRLYPPINPQSGGPTGTSLLGSVLALVMIVLFVPHGLGLDSAEHAHGPRLRRWVWVVLLAHSAFFLAYGHGDRSHLELGQVLSLASVVVWWPLGARYLGTFTWPANSRRWLGAIGAWAAVLIVDGVLAFLPGVLEGWKFTNALVAHAHVAMAGLATSLVVLLLILTSRNTSSANVFDDRLAFRLWHGGTVVMVVVLTVLGTREGLDPGLVARGGTVVTLSYLLRWGAGVVMVVASVRWLQAAAAMAVSSAHPTRLEKRPA